MNTVIDEVLHQVDSVQVIGLGGQLIVFGENSEAVLTGKTEEDILIGAAELGKGRIMAFSHTGYGKSMRKQEDNQTNSTLYKNVRNWLTRKQQNTGYKILCVDNMAALKTLDDCKKYDILLSVGSRESTSESLVEEYIRDGGAFVMSVTPWGWLQVKRGKQLAQMPYYKILLKAGLGFSPNYFRDTSPKLNVEFNKASTANIHKNLKTMQDLDHFLERIRLMKQLNLLPPKAFCLDCDKLQNLWDKAEKRIHQSFSKKNVKTSNKKEKNLFEFWTFCACNIQCCSKKAPFIADFPGDYKELPCLSCESLEFKANYLQTFMTGCHVAAGTPAKINVESIKNSWKIIIGAHNDYLDGDRINRWPEISKTILVDKTGEIEVSSPYGGSIYLESNAIRNSSIKICISNIVPQPLYDSQNKKSVEGWKENRLKPGLWADLSGEYVFFTFPSETIRHIDNPSAILDLYDKLFEAYYDLRGSDVRSARKMWIVADRQPSAGYMHSGYPIVTHLDVTQNGSNFLLDVGNFKKGLWGLFHEMGHNMQQGIWTFLQVREVTVNIFTLYAMQIFCDQAVWINPWLQKEMGHLDGFFNNGAPFDDWGRKPGLALFIYAQLVNCFGWESYKKVFRSYHTLPSIRHPRTDQDKIDLWFEIFSETVKFNLQPLVEFWGIPLSQKCKENLKKLNLESFLPRDEITEKYTEHTSVVKKNFPGLVREVGK